MFCGSDRHGTVAEEVRDYFFKADDGASYYGRCRDCGSVWQRECPAGERQMQAYPSMGQLTEAVLAAISG